MFHHLHDAAIRRSRGAFRLLGVLAMLGLTAMPCAAQQPPPETDALRPFTDKFNITTTVPEPVEFVKKSRPATMDYRPVGIVPPTRGTKIRTADEVKSLEAEMESTRRRHDVASRRLVPGVKAKPGDGSGAKPASRPAVKPARTGG